MARGNAGTFAPSSVTVQTGTFVPTATTATTVGAVVADSSAAAASTVGGAPRFSTGTHGLRRATATLAEPMRSASRSSSIGSLVSPTTPTATTASGGDHDHTISQTYDGDGTAMTRPFRPLRGPRNPPMEMNEATLHSFAAHRSLTAAQSWDGGGGGGSSGNYSHGPMPTSFQHRAASSTISRSLQDLYGASRGNNSTEPPNLPPSHDGQPPSSYPTPTLAPPSSSSNPSYPTNYQQRPPADPHFRRINIRLPSTSISAATTTTAATNTTAAPWPYPSASSDSPPPSADERVGHGTREPVARENEPPRIMVVTTTTGMRSNGMEQALGHTHDYLPHHHSHLPAPPPVGPRYPANAATGGGGRRTRDASGTAPPLPPLPSVGSQMDGARRRLAPQPLVGRNRLLDDREDGSGLADEEEEEEDITDSSSSLGESQSEGDVEERRPQTPPPPPVAPPGAPRMGRHEAFRRPQSSYSEVGGSGGGGGGSGGSGSSINYDYHHPPPMISQQQQQQQQHGRSTTLAPSQGFRHSTTDEYSSTRYTNTYRTLPRSTSSLSIGSQTINTYPQHPYQPPQPQQSQQQQQQQQQQASVSHHPVHPHETIPLHPRPAFLSQPVYQLACAACIRPLCLRAMKAVMLSDHSKELYSTDMPPSGLQLVNDDRQVRHCACRIRDSACLGCGQVIGYHVTQPCSDCLQDQNNGHFWMFYSSAVLHFRRIHKVGSSEAMMLWADVPSVAHDQCLADHLRLAIPTLNPKRQQLQRLVIAATTSSSSSNQGYSHGSSQASATAITTTTTTTMTTTNVGPYGTGVEERPLTAWIDMADWLRSPVDDVVCR